jgi:hypothetical protein
VAGIISFWRATGETRRTSRHRPVPRQHFSRLKHSQGTPTRANFAMFRFSSTASDTNFQCITGEGTTLTITDSGVLPVIHQANVFAIEFVDATPAVKFYIDGTLVATSTTHLPGASAILGYQCGVSCASPNTCLCGFSQVQIWSDR